MPAIFQSKKFWVLLGSVALILLVDVFGFSPDDAEKVQQLIAALGGTYLAAQGFADGMSRGLTSSVKK